MSLLYLWILLATPMAGGDEAGPDVRDDPSQRPRLIVQSGSAAFGGAIAISPDGSLVVTGDGARLWDVATGRQLGRLGNNNQIDKFLNIQFLPERQRILTGDASGNVRLWDLATLGEARSFVGHTGSVSAVAISSDGKRALTGSSDRTARLWDLETGKELRCLRGHTSEVTKVAISPDGRFLLTGGKDATMRLWRMDPVINGEPVIRLPAGVRSALAFSPDGERAVVGCENGYGAVWELFPMKEVCRLRLPPIHAAAWSANGSRVVTVGSDRTLRLWDPVSGAEVGRQTVDPGYVFAASFAADRLVAISGSDDRQSSYAAKVWDYVAGREVRRLRGYTDHHRALAFPSDRRNLLMDKWDGTTSLWDLSAGREVHRFPSDGLRAISGDGRRIITGSERILTGTGGQSGSSELIAWNVANRQKIAQFKYPWRYISWLSSKILFMPNDEQILTQEFEDNAVRVRVRDLKTGLVVRSLPGVFDREALSAITADGHRLVTTRGSRITTWDLDTGQKLRVVECGPPDADPPDPSTDYVGFSTLSEDLRSLLMVRKSGQTSVWDADTGTRLCDLTGSSGLPPYPRGPLAVFLGRGELAATVKGRVWDTRTGAEVSRFNGHTSGIVLVAGSVDGRFVLSCDSDQNTCLWEARTGRELCRLVSFRNGESFIVAPDGRFDTGALEGVIGLHWVFPDDPFRTLEPEIFLRDYYEPRLLARLMAGEAMPPVRPLSELNRVQPGVRIASVQPGEEAGLARVTVEVNGTEGQFGREGAGRLMRTGVYDLRLFRGGQLVGRWPEPGDEGAPEPDPMSMGQMTAWRDDNRIELGPGGRAARTFMVRLPHRAVAGPVEFTAYAFNEDRVKSGTANRIYNAPTDPLAGKPRAYLICMGVAASQSRRHDLAFPASDARQVREVLGGALEREGRYEVVPIVLTSERAEDGLAGVVTATKANLDAALDLLAGRPVDVSAQERLPGGDKLRAATPDDLVVLSFSGHGYTDARGVLYLLPYDVGDDQSDIAAVLPRCISTSELSAWLKNVDAGELVLVVDACHSAAAVQQPGFKPGPLGGRGLGQLAYDKGMRILAASQANDVALESAKLNQGLLTYALLKDGLERRRAARDGVITLGGLLSYAAERVPALYREVLAGEVKDAAGGATRNIGAVRPKEGQASGVQRPEFFDYDRSESEVVLHEGAEGAVQQ